MIYYKDFDFQKCLQTIGFIKHKSGHKAGGKFRYRNAIITFDIETSCIYEEHSICYLWSMCLNGQTIYGRTLDSAFYVFDILSDDNSNGEKFIIYVHNLSYEIVYLMGKWDFGRDDILWLKSRRALKADYKHLEFRCSYMLSGKSLERFTKDMKVQHKKLSGEQFDYSEKRYPWTHLTEYQLAYSENDVLGLYEALQKQLEFYGDTLETVPLTKTGYVRRMVKAAMRVARRNVYYPDYNVYKLLRLAFRGGNTHANRYRIGYIINDVYSYDKASSYPEQELCRKFPVTPFFVPKVKDLDECQKCGFAFVTLCRFENIRLKDRYTVTVPYIPHSKAIQISKYKADNGRVLSADSIDFAFIDIDWTIIKNQYEWDSMEVMQIYCSRYGNIPKPFKDVVYKLYKDKTKLKGTADDFAYMFSKENLNSTYGMMVEDILKAILYFSNLERKFVTEEIEDPGGTLTRKNKRVATPYHWGVWVTAYARLSLQKAIDILGDDFIYCDTDSVKFTGDHTADMEKINADILNDSIKYPATDSKGNKHFLGVFECEGKYKNFKTYGAKKYAYTDQDDTFHITIAGVGKIKGAQELGSIENFNLGRKFELGGGTMIKYHNDKSYGKITVDGRQLEITQNATILPSTYTLSISDEFDKLLYSLGIMTG